MVSSFGKVTKKRYDPRMKFKYDFDVDPAGPALPALPEALGRLDAVAKDLDAVVLTSKDAFISEYVPKENSLRFGATRFTGSVGDAIYFTNAFRSKHPGLKPILLFVDGRYHLQADQEVDPSLVSVVKLDVEPNIEGGLQKALSVYPGIKVGMDFERASVAGLASWRRSVAAHGASLHPLEGGLLLQALGLPGWKVSRRIFSLPPSATGRTLASNFEGLAKAMNDASGNGHTLHVTATADDAAFLLNARGFHTPNHASVLAYTFFAGQELAIFLPACSKDSPVELDPAQSGGLRVTVIRDSVPELKAWIRNRAVKEVFFNAPAMNAFLPEMVREIHPEAAVHRDFDWVLKTRTRKTAEEMDSIRSAFLRSSRAIAATLRWGKAESLKRKLSERELADHLSEAYLAEGAVSLSFSTISGAGANSAIVHYSKPSKTEFFDTGKIALLDSGAYYDNGFCTDCTRGFFAGGGGSGVKPEAWQVEIYTATLKAAIQVFLAPVDAKLSGKEVDALIRGKVKEAGYDYLHGTGHGIGIHVHEEGIRLSTLSIYPQSAHACVSVEPGIYLKDRGGVRVENVALLIPEGDSRYAYENVVFVGYDWDLVDLSKLTPGERAYLKSYEAKCRELGTTLTACPL